MKRKDFVGQLGSGVLLDSGEAILVSVHTLKRWLQKAKIAYNKCDSAEFNRLIETGRITAGSRTWEDPAIDLIYDIIRTLEPKK